jgi:hypothetical protein
VGKIGSGQSFLRGLRFQGDTVPPILPRKSLSVSRELGCSYHSLLNLIRFQKIDPPVRDESGDYAWLPSDIARARAALDARQRKEAARV